MSEKHYGTITTEGLISVGAPNPDGGVATKYWVKKYVAENGGGSTGDLSNYLTKTEASSTYQPKGNYATTAQLDTKADKSSVPTKVSQLTNDSNYVNNTQLATKSDKITEISGGNGEVTQELEPNKYYVFGECTTITITLASEVTGIFNEYLFKFTSGSTATVLNLPETCKWIGDNTIEANKEYIVSIVDNMAVLGGA